MDRYPPLAFRNLAAELAQTHSLLRSGRSYPSSAGVAALSHL